MLKQFEFSTTHDDKDGPFPVDFLETAIPNVLVQIVPLEGTLKKYVFTVVISSEEDSHEWAFHIGRAIQEKRHATLMKDYIDNHLRDTSN